MTDRRDPDDGASNRRSLRTHTALRLDETDLKILRLLQTGAHESISSLAEHIHLSRTGTVARIQKLERARIIVRYMAEIDESLFEPWVIYSVDIRLAARGRRDRASLNAALASVPEILEAVDIFGKYDLRLRVAMRSLSDWRSIAGQLDPHADLFEKAQMPVAMGEMRKRAAPHPFLLPRKD